MLCVQLLSLHAGTDNPPANADLLLCGKDIFSFYLQILHTSYKCSVTGQIVCP